MKRPDTFLRRFAVFLFLLFPGTWALALPDNTAKTLRVGSDHDYPPYEFNDKNGNPSGFNVELINAVCRAVGLQADVRLDVWDNVREKLKKGEIDVIAGMYYSEERAKTVGFTVPHNMVSSALFVRLDSDIKTFDDAKGREIIVQKGDIMHDYLVEQNFTHRIVTVADPAKALSLLAEGHHDGVLLSSRIQGLYFINRLDHKGVRVLNTPLPPREYCFAVRKGGEDIVQKLNEGLAALRLTGEYQTLYEKWFGVYDEKASWKISREFIAVFAVILALLAIISGISWALRIQVKRKTRELMISEKRYRHLVQNASDILSVTDENGDILYINPIVETILGYTQEDMTGKRFYDFVHPDYLDGVKAFYKEQFRTRTATTYREFPVLKKEGGLIWLGQNAQLLEGRDDVKGFQAMARDITERKRVEEDLDKNRQFLSDLIENSGALIYVKDCEGRYEMANRKWEDVTGLPRTAVLGRTDEELFSGSLGQAFRENDIHVMETGSVLEKEDCFVTPGGTRYFLTIKFPLRDGDGQVRGVCGISTEITERKKADEERARLSDRLQRAEKMEALGTLAGGVAHDLNNVLGILVGYSELLLDDMPENSPLREHVEQIMQGGMRAAAIVQDLLTMARRGVQTEDVINVNALISDFIKTPECIGLCSRNSSISIRTDLTPFLLNIKGSSPHLFKTLLNLLTNAVEAMPRGGVVTVSTANIHLEKPVQGYDSVQEGDYVVLTVADTGEGIPEEDIRHIFEPFYTKKVMGRSGTGLGLAVVWGTVKDHNGYIDVRSSLGEGTVFTLYLPVTRDEHPLAQTAAASPDLIGNGESILVVDDVKEQRELAEKMLTRMNYRMRTAASGEEAVGLLASATVDLVILDMIMDPGMDGLSTYRKILEIHPRQKAIIVSGYSSTDRVAEAQALGAGDYVKKPYVFETLGLAVKKELEKR
jgi:PAS domain S-box-containing protein